MDIDEIVEDNNSDHGGYQTEGQSLTKSQPKRTANIVIDDEHPFELDAYISGYTGRMTVFRLIHIASQSQYLAPTALQLAIQLLSQTQNVSLYLNTVSEYNGLASVTEPIVVNNALLDEATAKNLSEKNRLEVELKQYTSNMIKESIRMAHRDLGEYHLSVGDYNSALKSYAKSREFCTVGQHIIDMCLSVLQLLIEQRNYGHIATYVFKAEAALEASTISNKENIQIKVEFATALGHLGQSNYDRAAYGFLKLGPAKNLSEWLGNLVSPGDIAIYGTLCALTSLSRSAIKASVVDNATFGVYMEQEPYVRDLVDAYMNSKFKTVLEILERYSTRHYFDIHLSPHVQTLTSQIRDRALALYFQPFQSIRLERMGEAFGMSVEEIEGHVVRLIQVGSIKARVDSRNKILQARGRDPRSAMFSNTVKTGIRIQEANRKLLLRMKLIQADLIVKAPKGARHESALHEMME